MRRKTLGLAALGWLAVGPLVPLPAAAQENELRVLVPRLERLESAVGELQRRAARGGTGAPAQGFVGSDPQTAAITRLDDRITLLERQLADLTGRIEETGYRLEQLRGRLDKMAADQEFRLGALEKAAGPPKGEADQGGEVQLRPPPPRGQATPPPRGQGQSQAAAAPPPRGAEAGPPPGGKLLPEGTPMEQYNFAIGLLARQDYPQAEAAFREFISQHPSDRLAGNAQYWLGETYYVRNDMTRAAQSFLEGAKKYPDGAKAADTMLKLGMALTALNQKNEACGVFGELKSRYPSMSKDTAQGLVTARERAGCR